MRENTNRNVFEKELRKRLLENKRLYQNSLLASFDLKELKFVASVLGVNPWKVIVPFSLLIAILTRLVFGVQFSETVLDLLGGKDEKPSAVFDAE
jgi:hypothetical protein